MPEITQVILSAGRSNFCHSAAIKKTGKCSKWKCIFRFEVKQMPNSGKLEQFMNCVVATALESWNILNSLLKP